WAAGVVPMQRIIAARHCPRKSRLKKVLIGKKFGGDFCKSPPRVTRRTRTVVPGIGWSTVRALARVRALVPVPVLPRARLVVRLGRRGGRASANAALAISRTVRALRVPSPLCVHLA